jgi:alpha-1,3-rhamnosyl/mannosyltransferase
MEPASPEASREVARRLGLPPRYFLCVATFEPRKNHALLFRALAELRDPSARLVLVGKPGWKHEELQRALARSGVANQVMRLENVANADLPAIYSGAELFLFPSLYEGFGFPVLEAMACGTPVLASNASSLPEVAGGAARLLPTDDASAWVEAIRALRDDAQAREAMRRRGLARAAELTWERTARETIALYREAHDRRS